MKKVGLAALCAAALLSGCAADPAPTRPGGTAPVTEPVSTQATAPDVYSIAVQTPCGTVYLPDSWDIPIEARTEPGEPAVISFWAEDVKLYELTFSAEPEGAVGVAETEQGSIFVGLRLSALEGDQLQSMQETVNELLLQLQLDSVPAPAEDLTVQTQWGVLHFPLQWEECLRVEPDGTRLRFCGALPGHEPVPLFTLCFDSAGGGGICAVITAEDGTKTNFTIGLHEPELNGDWTDAEKNTIYAMQEDVNYLLDALDG